MNSINLGRRLSGKNSYVTFLLSERTAADTKKQLLHDDEFAKGKETKNGLLQRKGTVALESLDKNRIHDSAYPSHHEHVVYRAKRQVSEPLSFQNEPSGNMVTLQGTLKVHDLATTSQSDLNKSKSTSISLTKKAVRSTRSRVKQKRKRNKPKKKRLRNLHVNVEDESEPKENDDEQLDDVFDAINDTGAPPESDDDVTPSILDPDSEDSDESTPQQEDFVTPSIVDTAPVGDDKISTPALGDMATSSIAASSTSDVSDETVIPELLSDMPTFTFMDIILPDSTDRISTLTPHKITIGDSSTLGGGDGIFTPAPNRDTRKSPILDASASDRSDEAMTPEVSPKPSGNNTSLIADDSKVSVMTPGTHGDSRTELTLEVQSTNVDEDLEMTGRTEDDSTPLSWPEASSAVENSSFLKNRTADGGDSTLKLTGVPIKSGYVFTTAIQAPEESNDDTNAASSAPGDRSGFVAITSPGFTESTSPFPADLSGANSGFGVPPDSRDTSDTLDKLEISEASGEEHGLLSPPELKDLSSLSPVAMSDSSGVVVKIPGPFKEDGNVLLANFPFSSTRYSAAPGPKSGLKTFTTERSETEKYRKRAGIRPVDDYIESPVSASKERNSASDKDPISVEAPQPALQEASNNAGATYGSSQEDLPATTIHSEGTRHETPSGNTSSFSESSGSTNVSPINTLFELKEAPPADEKVPEMVTRELRNSIRTVIDDDEESKGSHIEKGVTNKSLDDEEAATSTKPAGVYSSQNISSDAPISSSLAADSKSVIISDIFSTPVAVPSGKNLSSTSAEVFGKVLVSSTEKPTKFKKTEKPQKRKKHKTPKKPKQLKKTKNIVIKIVIEDLCEDRSSSSSESSSSEKSSSDSSSENSSSDESSSENLSSDSQSSEKVKEKENHGNESSSEENSSSISHETPGAKPSDDFDGTGSSSSSISRVTSSQQSPGSSDDKDASKDKRHPHSSNWHPVDAYYSGSKHDETEINLRIRYKSRKQSKSTRVREVKAAISQCFQTCVQKCVNEGEESKVKESGEYYFVINVKPKNHTSGKNEVGQQRSTTHTASPTASPATKLLEPTVPVPDKVSMAPDLPDRNYTKESGNLETTHATFTDLIKIDENEENNCCGDSDDDYLIINIKPKEKDKTNNLSSQATTRERTVSFSTVIPSEPFTTSTPKFTYLTLEKEDSPETLTPESPDNTLTSKFPLTTSTPEAPGITSTLEDLLSTLQPEVSIAFSMPENPVAAFTLKNDTTTFKSEVTLTTSSFDNYASDSSETEEYDTSESQDDSEDYLIININRPIEIRTSEAPERFPTTNSKEPLFDPLSSATTEDLLLGKTPEDSLSVATPGDSLLTTTPEDPHSAETPKDSLATAMSEDHLSTVTPKNPLLTAFPEDLSAETREESLSTATSGDTLSNTTPGDLLSTATPRDRLSSATSEDSLLTAGPENPLSTTTPDELLLSTVTPEDPLLTATPEDPLTTAKAEDPLSTAKPEDPLSTATPDNPFSKSTPDKAVTTASSQDHISTLSPESEDLLTGSSETEEYESSESQEESEDYLIINIKRPAEEQTSKPPNAAISASQVVNRELPLAVTTKTAITGDEKTTRSLLSSNVQGTKKNQSTILSLDFNRSTISSTKKSVVSHIPSTTAKTSPLMAMKQSTARSINVRQLTQTQNEHNNKPQFETGNQGGRRIDNIESAVRNVMRNFRDRLFGG